MSGPVQTPVTAPPCKRSPGHRSRLWRAKAMKVAVLLVNGYFLLGMGDCNNTNGPLFSAPTGPTLSALTLSAGLLNPSFDPDVTSYDAMFIGDTSVTITPTAAEADTTIMVNSSPVTSGNTSGAINLPSGNTTITIILTANGLTNTYTITAHRLAQQAYLKTTNQGAGDELGYSIALDGDTLVVGARNEDGSGTGVNPAHNNLGSNAGAAYVFVRSGTTWTQQAYLKASNTGANDWFGYSVALAGNTLAVGAPFEDGSATGVNGADDDGTLAAGAVYVFTRSGTIWSQQAYIKASNTGADDQFGRSVALSGETLVVGAPEEDGSGIGVNPTSNNLTPNSGAVYIFTRSGTTWSQQAYLKASNPDVSDLFGESVALDGDTLAVGAKEEDSILTGVTAGSPSSGVTGNGAGESGAVYIFTRSGTVWSQQAYVKASNAEANDLFGISVAVSDNTVAIGARSEDSNATGINGADNNSASASGATYVFTRTGTTWSQQAYIKASNTQTGDNFGATIDVDSDILIVGTGFDLGGPFPSEDSGATGVNGNDSDNSIVDSGAAYIFRRVGSTWSQQAYVKASNTGSDDLFGIAVAVSGDTIAVGAHLEDSNATTINPGAGAEADNSAGDAGAVYVFQ